jgi:hypothetical protein
MGLSFRLAQDLRLMQEPNNTFSAIEQEEHRRTFWSIYLLDRLVSCGRARPPYFSNKYCQLRLPCDELVFRNGAPNNMPKLDDIGLGTSMTIDHNAHFALVILISSILCRCVQYSIHENSLEGCGPPWNPTSEYAAIYSTLLDFETQYEVEKSLTEALGGKDFDTDNSLDQQWVGQLIFTRVVFHLCYCLLNHPFLMRQRLKHGRKNSVFLLSSGNLAKEHALALSKVMHESMNMKFHVSSSFYGYSIILSGGILALHANSNTETLHRECEEYYQFDLSFLDALAQHWPSGGQMVCLIFLVSSSTYDMNDANLPMFRI